MIIEKTLDLTTIQTSRLEEMLTSEFENYAYFIQNEDVFQFHFDNSDNESAANSYIDALTVEDIDAQCYARYREIEYNKIDALRIEAMVEKELGDDTKWLEYIALRDAIKVEYPKP